MRPGPVSEPSGTEKEPAGTNQGPAGRIRARLREQDPKDIRAGGQQGG